MQVDFWTFYVGMIGSCILVLLVGLMCGFSIETVISVIIGSSIVASVKYAIDIRSEV